MSAPFDQQVTLSQKPKSQLYGWGLSLPFDQQVTLTSKTQVPTLDVVVSPPWQRTPSTAFRCLHLLISKWDWLQKPKSQLFGWGRLSPPFDQQVTLSPKNLGHNFGWGLSPPHVNMRCSLLTIKFGNKRIAVRNLLYIHNSQKSKIQCFGWMFVSAVYWL